MATLGFAVSAAALVTAGPGVPAGAQDGPDGGGVHDTRAGRPEREASAAELVVAPVRIADAATARLLRPGDRVDVVATGESPAGGDARVLAEGARVMAMPAPARGLDPRPNRHPDSGSGSVAGTGTGTARGTGSVVGGTGAATDATTGSWADAGGGADAASVTGVTEETGGGALVLLSVPRPTAARLVGAAATSRLAVTLC